MSNCPGCGAPWRFPPDPPPGRSVTPLQGPQGAQGTRLIVDAGDRQVYALNRETDARTALTRGLAEYLAQLSVDFQGRPLAFANVFSSWAQPETQAIYPSAVVYSVEEGAYDASKLTMDVNPRNRLPPPNDNAYVVSPAEFTLDVTIEIWATDPLERAAIVAMVEDAFSPSTWIGAGIRLELPHYCNERAEFEMISSRYEDTDEDSVRRYRKAFFKARGRVPVVRVQSFPKATIRSKVAVTSPNGVG